MSNATRNRNARNYLAGIAAEDAVARTYTAMGHELRHVRWKAMTGEIDLVVWNNPQLVFCEVKQAPTHDAALTRITPEKVARLYHTAQAYLAAHDFDQLTDMRFDAGLVDAKGAVKVIENAFA